MSVLKRKKIIECINAGLISITPYNEENIQPASYDLRLGYHFSMPKPKFNRISQSLNVNPSQLPPQLRGLPIAQAPKPIPRKMDEEWEHEELTIPQDSERGLILNPKQFVLATTLEHISIPQNMIAYVKTRSSVGRMGIKTVNAEYIDPGFHGEITLEILNESDVPVEIMPGRRVCQLVFELTESDDEDIYSGKYIEQKGATASRIYQDKDI